MTTVWRKMLIKTSNLFFIIKSLKKKLQSLFWSKTVWACTYSWLLVPAAYALMSEADPAGRIPRWYQEVTSARLAHKSVTFALIVMQSECDSPCEGFCLPFKPIGPLCSHYFHWKAAFPFGNHGSEAIKQVCDRIIQHALAITTHSSSPLPFPVDAQHSSFVSIVSKDEEICQTHLK